MSHVHYDLDSMSVREHDGIDAMFPHGSLFYVSSLVCCDVCMSNRPWNRPYKVVSTSFKMGLSTNRRVHTHPEHTHTLMRRPNQPEPYRGGGTLAVT